MTDRPEFFSYIKGSTPNTIVKEFDELMALYDFTTESEIHSIENATDFIYDIKFKDKNNLNKFVSLLDTKIYSYTHSRNLACEVLELNKKSNNIKIKIIDRTIKIDS